MERNSDSKKYLIITSINSLNKIMEKYASLSEWKFILVGDKKGPKEINDDRIIFLDIGKQAELGFTYHASCPENHYARKNIGYLYAIANGAEIIAESDDDNMPKKGWGENIDFSPNDIEVFDSVKFFNAYAEFHDSVIWPRGFPLEYILTPSEKRSSMKKAQIGVWQQLADDDPDVDAIYRLTCNQAVRFQDRNDFALAKHVYCPFNSQNTFWTRKTFPFMYLPKTVTFRFTDILRGYITQRLLWEENLLLGFGGASVCQDRNQHNLMHDFIDEIPMYLNVDSIVKRLDSLNLSGTPLENLSEIYKALLEDKVVTRSELVAVERWEDDLKRLGFR